MDRSPNSPPVHMSPGVCVFHGSVQGAGAAIPVIPTTTHSTTAALHPMSAQNNYVSATAGDITRSGVGAYTLKLKDRLPVILDIAPNVWGADGKRAQVTGYDPSTRILSVQVYSAAGAAADLASTDNLKLTVYGQLSTY
jgi:hypothetical protein